MRSDKYQIALIALGIAATLLFAHFLYKEIFPEYRIFQDDYIALEEFRSTYTGEPPPAFKTGVKQLVFEREDKGPAKIDRCTSCHVAMQLPHFSPTRIEHDINGNIVRGPDGTPELVPNEDYVWGRLENKINELRDAKVNEQLAAEGSSAKVDARMREAARLEALKTREVDGHVIDMTKVLAMHPLIGKETRPFEFHPLEENGCTVCHSGNGRALTIEKAHGPVFDETYEAEYMGPKPEFTERDKANDPRFASVFNDKPSDALLFQTTPILVGNLIESSCVQCHRQSAQALTGLADTASSLASLKKKKNDAMRKGFVDEELALASLLKIKRLVASQGIKGAVNALAAEKDDVTALPDARDQAEQQLDFLKDASGKNNDPKALLAKLDAEMVRMIGSAALLTQLEKDAAKETPSPSAIDKFLAAKKDAPDAKGTLFVKMRVLDLESALLEHVEESQGAISTTVSDEAVIAGMASDVDWLTKDFSQGKELFFSQACYACHRIAGTARGGIGPELTNAGESYPWFLKESIVWPQADLATSTMPNFMLDHVEIEDLMTFLLAQKGANKAISQIEYKQAIQEWEAGRKTAIEKPIPPSKVHDLRYGMTIFATQGCAACHRLEGFASDVGFSKEKDPKASFGDLLKEKQWFSALFPEEMRGSRIAAAIDSNADEIDKRIVKDVRKGSILEEIDKNHPGIIESFYSDFRYASRAKDAYFKDLMQKAASPEKVKEAERGLAEWRERVRRVLLVYIQEYGLGRLIGPRPNWSGVYRTDEWLMEHFRNPASHVPRSIMPILPFDDTKFYALTYMLDVLGRQNRDRVRAIWQYSGFEPERAFQIFCSQCHGDYLLGNGPVAAWIYPIPKNLRNAEFLRNLTRENAVNSIRHGVKGTPMPPWGETPSPKPDYDGIPVLTNDEIEKLVDWLYTSLPGSTVIRGSEDVPKWNYTPEDVIKELEREKNTLVPGQETQRSEKPPLSSLIRKGKEYYLSTRASGGSLDKNSRLYAANDTPSKKTVPDAISSQVEQIFDVLPNPIPGGEKTLYYIKNKYYTKENIEKGKDFFELNCAVCHGREADGTGMRAGIMVDAKPRMLNNLDWIKTRDDLRLLRSIKYGVAGTAMTPWGDLTSSLQRLQLVIFIRTLSEEKEKRDQLAEALYAAFDTDAQVVDEVRIRSYPGIDAVEEQFHQLKQERPAKDGSIDASVSLYKKRLELEDSLNRKLAADKLLVDLRRALMKQKEIYQAIGNDMISSGVDGPIWTQFIGLIGLNKGQFSLKDGSLKMASAGSMEKIHAVANEIGDTLDGRIKKLEAEKVVINAKFPSTERDNEMRANIAETALLTKLRAKLLSGVKEDGALKEEVRKTQALIDGADGSRTDGQNLK